MEKSVIVAYLLWLIGGIFGLHLFYLGRDRHALVWWCTAGGCFGVGWLRDLCRIPEYVDEANNEQQFQEEMKHRKRFHARPPLNIVRCLGEVIVGSLYGFLVRIAVPEELLNELPLLKLISTLTVPLAVAIGVHLVANIGQEHGSLKITTVGAYITMPLYIFKATNITWVAMTATIALNWKGKVWRLKPKKQQHLCKRIAILGVCGLLYSSLWTCSIYHNAYVTTRDQEKVRLKDAIWNFFTSPAWEETKSTMRKLWQEINRKGFFGAWEEFIISIDPEGEYNSYRVLDISTSASEEEVAVAYRKLVRKWHPDKHKDPQQKEIAEKEFMKIQQAYETISKIKGRRAKKNKRNK